MKVPARLVLNPLWLLLLPLASASVKFGVKLPILTCAPSTVYKWKTETVYAWKPKTVYDWKTKTVVVPTHYTKTVTQTSVYHQQVVSTVYQPQYQTQTQVLVSTVVRPHYSTQTQVVVSTVVVPQYITTTQSCYSSVTRPPFDVRTGIRSGNSHSASPGGGHTDDRWQWSN